MSESIAYASADRFREVFNRVEAYVERRYGVPVVISDVTDPFTGDLDGETITVDYDLEGEEALFIIAHLFGHTVQWNLSARAREIGSAISVGASEEELREIREYEKTACRYSLQLFHDAGVDDLDQWMSDFAACDSAYLIHFYTTGEKKPFRAFWQRGMPQLEGLTIPEFQPTRWLARSDGVVI